MSADQIPAEALAAARRCYDEWRATPNREAYVWNAIHAALASAAPALVAAGRAEAAAEMRAQIADLGLADEDAVALMAGFAEGGDRG